MKLYYYKAPEGNFGDDLNVWLWPKLFPAFFDRADDILFVGIGTILDDSIPSAERTIVFGSGAKNRDRLPRINDRWDIRFVRGPGTARLIGLGTDKAITDGAYCLEFIDRENSSIKTHKYSFMPHVANVGMPLSRICRTLGLNYVDPRSDVETVLKEVGSSEYLVTEAMHGAIVADILRVPWVQVKVFADKSEAHFSDFKWQDWRESLSIVSEAGHLPAMWPPTSHANTIRKRCIYASKISLATIKLRWLMRYGQFRLSSDAAIQRIYDRLSEEIETTSRLYA